MAALIFKPPTRVTEEYRNQVALLKTRGEKLEIELSKRSAQFRSVTQPATIEAVQKLIPTSAALVELVLYKPESHPKAATKSDRYGKPHYAAYVLHPQGEPKWVDLGEAEPIDRLVEKFRDALRRQDYDVRAIARELDALLMQPIRPLLSKSTHILLSPDSQLNLIPFAALVDENNRYLIETYTITHLTSGRDLLRLQTHAPSRQDPVVIANPDFDNPGNPQTVRVAAIAPSSNSQEKSGMRAARRSTDLASLRFAPLKGTELEKQAIAPLLPNVTVLTQSQATENALKQLQAPSILHIATHGFFLQDVD